MYFALLAWLLWSKTDDLVLYRDGGYRNDAYWISIQM